LMTFRSLWLLLFFLLEPWKLSLVVGSVFETCWNRRCKLEDAVS
jgi:hypothetical protein